MKRRTKGSGTIVKIGNVYYGRITRHVKTKVVRLSTNQRESETLWRDWLLDNPVAKVVRESAKHDIEGSWPALENKLISKNTTKDVFKYYRNYFERFCNWCKEKDKKTLDEISSSDIVKYLDECTEGQSNVTKKNHLYMIKGLFETNIPEMIPPTKGIRLRSEESTPRQPFTDDELKKILDSASNHIHGQQFKVMIEVGLYTGLRRKDCVHLRKESVKENVLMVTPYKTKHRGTMVRIPLHPKLKESLDSLSVSSGYFFPDLVDLYRRRTLSGHLKTIFSKAGNVKIDVQGRKRKVPLKGFHALRATFITRLAESGVSLPIMESLAGHLNPSQTMHYTHPDEDVKKAAIDVLNYSGNPEEDKIFLHPDVKKLMDVFEKQKEEFLAKMEDTISRLADSGEIDKSILGHVITGNVPDTSSGLSSAEGEVNPNDFVKVKLDSAFKRKILARFIVLPKDKSPDATVNVKKKLLDTIGLGQ